MLHKIGVLFVSIALLIFPVSLTAQEDFVVSETEIFSIEHPENWIISDLVAGQALITAANSQRLADQLNETTIDDVLSGEQGYLIYLIPTEYLTTIETTDTTPQEFIAAIRDLVMTTDDGSLSFGEPEVVAFDEREIGIISFSDSEAVVDGYYLAYHQDDITIIPLIIAHRGELAELEDVAFDMLASFQLKVSAEELLESVNQ